MPDLITRRSAGSAAVVELPPVWGPRVVGQIGDADFTLLVDGRPVTRRYRATRSGWITVNGERRSVRIAGSGGHATKKAYRRRGYNGVLDHTFLTVAQKDGFDLAMLFCVLAQAPYNAKLGWHMVTSEMCHVTYRQPKTGAPVVCPPHIAVGLRTLVPMIDVTQIAAVEVEGLPW